MSDTEKLLQTLANLTLFNGTFPMNHTYTFHDSNTESPSSSSSSSHSYIRTVLMGIGIVTAVLTIISNISLSLIVMFNKQFRVQPFYWHILSLCASDLLVGVCVIPFGVSYIWESSWKHGVEFCKIWSLLEITHFSLSASILIALCIDRLEAKRSSLQPVSIYRTKLVPIALFLFPWVFIFFVCLPVLIVGERQLDIPRVMHRDICIFILEEEFYLPAFSVTYIFPIIVLAIVSVTMVVFYQVKSREWYQLTDDDRADSDKFKLRSSTIATLVVSVVTLVFWLPYLIILLMIVTCQSGMCLPNMWAYTVTYTLSMMTSPITPVLWLVHTEIRHAYRSIFVSVLYKFGLCRNWRPADTHSELLEENAEL